MEESGPKTQSEKFPERQLRLWEIYLLHGNDFCAITHYVLCKWFPKIKMRGHERSIDGR